MSENLKRSLLTNLPFSVVSTSLFKGLTWTEFGITKAIKITLKSYIRNTSTPIIPTDFNNIPEVRPLDPSRRGQGAGHVLYMAPALPCVGKKPTWARGCAQQTYIQPFYSKFQKVRILNFLPKKPWVHFGAVWGLLTQEGPSENGLCLHSQMRVLGPRSGQAAAGRRGWTELGYWAAATSVRDGPGN